MCVGLSHLMLSQINETVSLSKQVLRSIVELSRNHVYFFPQRRLYARLSGARSSLPDPDSLTIYKQRKPLNGMYVHLYYQKEGFPLSMGGLSLQGILLGLSR